MTTNQPNKRLFSGAAGTLALTARRATTLTVTRAAMLLLVMLLTTATAGATTTSTITVGGTDYTLFTGFTATAGTAGTFGYANFVDGNTSTKWWVSKNYDDPNASVNDFAGGTEDPAYVEFHADAPFIPKGYILTYDNSTNENWKPTSWALKAKQNESDNWTTIHSSNSSLGNGSRFEIACNNNGDNQYQYFRFEIYDVGSTYQSILNELEFYGSSPDVYYTHLTEKAATCTETGIKRDCYQRNDGKYFTDETGTTELAESDVIEPMKPHTGVHHEATDVNIEYWQCSMCSKYFSDSGYTTEITEEQTKIYRTITIDDGISSLVTSSVDKALAGATVTLTVSHLIDANTLKVNNGSVPLTDAGNGIYTFTVPAADVTVTASTSTTYSVTLPANMEIVSATNAADGNGKYISGTVIKFAASFGYAATNVSDGMNTLEPDADGIYTVTVAEADINITATTESSNTLYLATANSDFTAADGNILIGATSHTVTIANNAKITLNNATITGGIVCDGTAEITLVGENAVGVTSLDGTLIYQTAGIQIGSSGTTLTIKGNGSLNATGGSASAGIGLGRTWGANATGGSVVIEGGTVTASGGNGIGTGTVGNEKAASIDGIIIKGGTVNARLGKGTINYGSSVTIGAIKIYDTIDKVDASAITESVTYMHDDTDVTASASTYFTIIEDGDRRIITLKDDTDYTITIVGNTEHGTIACTAATAKYGDKVTITATPDFGYRLSRLVVKDAQNNDVASTGNSFFMPKSNVTVSAVFEQGVHGTTEFAWGYSGPDSFVTEATIYDGVTTVELQQGKSYRIYKYDESSYRKFLLDNDTYIATIPYSGGTGTFTYANGTNFNINSGELGFYDITMTDVGNGKWSVSILKTVGVIDNIPDQTYTGSEIKPEPLVIAGSLSLTKGTDYTYSYENNTNVGTATVRATFQGTYASLGYVEKTFTIAPKAVTVTADDKTKEYGEADPTLTATVEGLVGDDAVTYTVSREAGEAVGTYAITPTGDASQGNYAVTYVSGTMTVTSNPTLALTANQAPDGKFWTTFYCGDAGYTIDAEENACAYTATYSDGKLTLHNQGKTIAKGEAVIIVADNNEVSMTKAGDGTCSDDNDLHGVDVETSTADIQTTLGAGTFYVLGMTNGNFGFHKYEGSEMAARKAFVLINGSNAALARSLTMVFDDATGITTVHGSWFTVNGSDAWYSLDGRRLQGKPVKSGVYVNNGKKIVIK